MKDDRRRDGHLRTCALSSALSLALSAGLTLFPERASGQCTDPLTSVSVTPPGPYSITTTATGVILDVIETGGGAVTRRWGYRSAPNGLITFLDGQTGTSYLIRGADFPGQGIYYVVVETTPECGEPRASDNEVQVQVTQDTPQDKPPAFTVTSTHQQNVLEWIYPVGRSRVQIRYSEALTWDGCATPMKVSEGTYLDTVSRSAPTNDRGWYPHTGLTNRTVYCYSIFTDVSGSFPDTTRRSVKGRPFDNTDPSERVKWAFSTGALSLAPPGLGPGILHVVSADTLYAIDKATGTWPTDWRPFGVPLPGPSQNRPTTVTISIGPASHVIFLGSQNGAGNNVLAVNASTGLGLWGQPVGAPVSAGPTAIITAGSYEHILLGNRNSAGRSGFFALDPLTGDIAPGWPYLGEPSNEIGIVSCQAAVDRLNRRAYFTSHQMIPGVSDSVWCVNLDTAARCSDWQVGETSVLGDLMTASPTLRSGRLYVAAINGLDAEVHALDAKTGKKLWGAPFTPRDGQIKLFILPDIFSRDLYFSTTNRVWSIRDLGTSWETKWQTNVPNASQPVYFTDDRLVWVGGGDGQLHTLNPSDGSDAVLPVMLGDGSAPAGAPSVDSANGFVYLGTTAGVVYAVQIQ